MINVGNVRVMHVLKEGVERDEGIKAQLTNITAAKTVADIIRTTLGPRSMLKMIIDPVGGVVLTNDGNAILRDINITHPAAKMMIELSRAQDEECGDGTTSVIILAGEVLALTQPLLEAKIRPILVCQGFARALEDAVAILHSLATKVDTTNDVELRKVVLSCLGTKAASDYEEMVADFAIKSVRTVARELANGRVEIDVKRYAKIEKIPGGQVTDSEVLDGVMFEKDLVHPKMPKVIENPRVVLLDCPLEYKKLESAITVEMTDEQMFTDLLQMEEDWIKAQVDAILAVKPNVVITEKGVSDFAAHLFARAGVACIRRLRKTDNNRIARATGATIVHRCEELREHDVGTRGGLFELKKIGDTFFTFITKCKDPQACTVILRGGSKDVLNEMERNLHDATNVARSIITNPALVPGGGAIEMAIAARLTEKAKTAPSAIAASYRSIAAALEVIPRTLVQNCGGPVLRAITDLRARHAAAVNAQAGDPSLAIGVNGETGELCDVVAAGIVDPAAVKAQVMKSAVESACVLIRIDAVVSGVASAGLSGNSRTGGDEAD